MRPLRLRTHFIVSYTVITFLLTASITALYTSRVKDHAIGSLSEYGIATTLNTAFALVDRLISEDYGPLQEFVRKFSSGTHVAAMEVSDPDWRTLAATDTKRLGSPMEREPPGRCILDREDVCVRMDDLSRQIIITAPIVWERIPYGQVRLYLSMGDILAHIQEIQRNGILVGCGFWLVALAIGFVLAQRLTGPMQGFVQATENISRGDFDVQLPSGGMVRELTAFSGALRVMAETIGAREQALLESERKFRHLFERALEGIFVADRQGRLLDANPAFYFVLGYPSKEVLFGHNLFADIFELEAYSFFAAQIEANSQIKDYELNLRKGDGSSIIAALTCHVVRDAAGNIERYEGLVRDITQQRRAEREVLRMRNYLNNIIESMPSMLVTVDQDSVVTQWNSAASQMTGIPSHEALGRKIYDIAPLFSKYQGQLAESSRTRLPVRLNREQVDKDADLVCNLTFFPLVANGSSGVAIRVDDVTELERKEQQLRQAQKMESVGTLAGGLAHDFNNVLGGIIGNLSLIQYKLDSGSGIAEPQLREYLERMSMAGNRAVDMVRQLLTLSRRHEVELVPVDLNLTIKHIRKLGENTFDKSVRVTTRPTEEPAYVLADPTEMEQVLLNLCINGVHAMTLMREQEQWGGELTVALERVEVDEAFQKNHPEAMPGCYWRLSVADTGVGMDTKTVSKIFDPFFTTKEKGKGTGLGLAMVYNIIRQHNGFVDVYTEKGLGSTLSVYLPLLVRQAGEVKDLDRGPALVRGEGMVLVVDDEDFVREAAKEILEAAGYTVLVAADGGQGVELFRTHRENIRLVLLDMVMPVMSGREAYLEMRKLASDVKVLLCSGFRLDARVEEILQLGVNGFLQKPYTLMGLTSAVKKTLEA